MKLAEPNGYEAYSNSEPVDYLHGEWASVRKVPSRDQNKEDWG